MAIVVSKQERIRNKIAKMLGEFEVIECNEFLDAVGTVSQYRDECVIIMADYILSPFTGIEFLDVVHRLNESIVSVLLIDGVNDEAEIAGLESEVDLIIDCNKSEEVIMAHVKKFVMAINDKSTRFSISSGGLLVNDIYIELTRKEREIVSILLEGKGMPVTREEIVKTVWKFAKKDNIRVVDLHIKAIRTKLSVEGLGDCIATISGVGYRWKYDD